MPCPLIYLSRVSEPDEEPRPAARFAGGQGGSGGVRRRERARALRRQGRLLHRPPSCASEDWEGKPQASSGGDDCAQHHIKQRCRHAAATDGQRYSGETLAICLGNLLENDPTQRDRTSEEDFVCPFF